VEIRAVIDTNIWVSALLNPHGFPARLRQSFENGLFEAVISEPLLLELAAVLSRPRIKDKYNIASTDIEELLVLIEERADHVILSGDIAVCRDTNDNFVIETAIKGAAPHIVTRDDDIKFDRSVAVFLSAHGISVSSVARFLSLLQKR